ncbi:MAG: major facilitator superfamily 1 [Rhodospirillales bacterium]|nr:major facilitator superfamily 1 [Rhodospirillales bacterium]
MRHLAIEETEDPLAGNAVSIPQRLIDRWRDWIGIAVMVSSAPSLALIFTATAPVLPLIAKHFAPGGQPAFTIPGLGISIDGPFFAQLVATMPSIGLMLGGGPTGLAIDRFGVRRVLLCALVAFAFFGSAGLYLDDPVWLLASRLALGFAAIAYGSATIWLIGGRFTDAGRARALSYRNILGGIAGLTSVLLAGHVAEAAGWQGVFILFLAPLLLIPATIFAIAPQSADRQKSAEGEAKQSLAFLWPIFTLAVLLAVVMMMNTAQLSFLLIDNGISSPHAQSHVMVAGSFMTMVGSILYSELGIRLGVRGNYSVPALLLGAGGITLGLSHGALMATLGAGLSGTGAGWMIPHFSRLILGRTPASARGRAVGLFFSAIYLGDLINPFVVRPLAVGFGIHRTFLIIGGVVAVSALQIFVPKRRPRE